ncbi:MAG TPA: hypothetical protein VHY79_15800 [Rhizomicrobium sp.]|nr:hypothetical protein [Rhizomicrobium sp.]
MACADGICAPTAQDAVLNVSDLENFLASGNLIVTTTGSGGVQSEDINVDISFAWSSASALWLDAYDTVAVDSAISVTGGGGLSLQTNDGGSGGVFSIGKEGNVTFGDLSSQVTINGTSYTLVTDVASLASAITANPAGSYALAGPYDASADGTYSESPIQTTFTGMFEGFGNAISNLSVRDKAKEDRLGLFSNNNGIIEHLGLLHAEIVGARQGSYAAGTLAGANGGYLFQDFATGRVTARGPGSNVGGLVGGTGSGGVSIDQSYADVRVDGGSKSKSKRKSAFGSGGLVGVILEGEIRQSFATGPVNVEDTGIAGGLAGLNALSTIGDCYATGAVTGGQDSKIGGLIGVESKGVTETVETSYSTGAVSGGESSLVGGFVGMSTRDSDYANAYWDTTTSGTDRAAGKGRSHGIEGLTTEQLQSGLPVGFDPSIWAKDKKINNGLPYLLNNPPPK